MQSGHLIPCALVLLHFDVSWWRQERMTFLYIQIYKRKYLRKFSIFLRKNIEPHLCPIECAISHGNCPGKHAAMHIAHQLTRDTRRDEHNFQIIVTRARARSHAHWQRMNNAVVATYIRFRKCVRLFFGALNEKWHFQGEKSMEEWLND